MRKKELERLEDSTVQYLLYSMAEGQLLPESAIRLLEVLVKRSEKSDQSPIPQEPVEIEESRKILLPIYNLTPIDVEAS